MHPDNQNPEQPEQPDVLPQGQTLSGSSARRTLQPLTPEDEIRSEALASGSISPNQQEASNSPVANTDGSETSSAGHSPMRFDDNIVDSRTSEAKLNIEDISIGVSSQKGIGKKIILISSLVIVAMLVAGAVYYLTGGKLVSAKLVETSAQNTSYYYPEGWEVISSDIGVETYVSPENSGQPAATVTINEGISVRYYGDEVSDDEYYKHMRIQAFAKETEDSIAPFFRFDGKDCTSAIDLDARPDERTGNTTVGLAFTTASCTRSDGKYTVKRLTVVGKDDGLHRQITVGASDGDWLKSGATYEAVLNSINQN